MAEIQLPTAGGFGAGRRRRGRGVPTIDDVAQVRVHSDPGVRVPDFAGAMGLEEAGRGAMRGVAIIGHAMERQQKEFDAIKTTEAELEFKKIGQAEFQRLQTEGDTTDPAFQKSFDSWLETQAKQIGAKLPSNVSDNARQRFQIAMDTQRLAFSDAAGRVHLASAQKKSQDLITQQSNTWTAQASRDPDALDGILENIKKGIDPFRGTMSPDAERDAEARSRSSAIVGAISGLVKNDRYMDAEKLIGSGKYDADLGPEALRSINADISRGKAVARSEIRDSTADHLASLRETGVGMPGLSERAKKILEPKDFAEFQRSEKTAKDVYGAVQQLKFATPEQARTVLDGLKPKPGQAGFANQQRAYDAVQQEVKRIEADALRQSNETIQVENAEVRDLIRADLTSRIETGKGVEGLTLYRIGAAAGSQPKADAAVREYIERRDMADKAFELREKLKTASPEEAHKMLADLAPKGGDPMFEDRQRAHDAIEKEWARVLKLRTQDPAAYAMQAPEVKQAFEAAQQDPAKLPSAVQRSLALQEQMGIPEHERRVMPKAMAEATVAKLATVDPETAADQIAALQTQYGNHWPRAYSELVREKLPPEMSILAGLDSPSDAVSRKDLATALKAGKKQLVDNLDSSIKTEVDRSLTGQLDRWTRTELSRGATEANVQAMRNSAEMLAYSYAARGASPSDAAKRAVTALIDNRFDFLDSGNFSMYVPKGKGAEIEAFGLSQMGTIKASDLVDPGGAPDLTETQRKDLYLKNVQRGRWILNESGDGAFLVDQLGQPVMKTDRKRVEFSFRNVQPVTPSPMTGVTGNETVSP
jgi:hypothetical protein